MSAPKAGGLRVLSASFCPLVGSPGGRGALVPSIGPPYPTIPIEGGDWGGSALVLFSAEHFTPPVSPFDPLIQYPTCPGVRCMRPQDRRVRFLAGSPPPSDFPGDQPTRQDSHAALQGELYLSSGAQGKSDGGGVDSFGNPPPSTRSRGGGAGLPSYRVVASVGSYNGVVAIIIIDRSLIHHARALARVRTRPLFT